MDDSAILAERARIREQRQRLAEEKEQLVIQLQELPLTKRELEEREANARDNALQAEQDELRDRKQFTLILIFGIFFLVCTVTGIALYLAGGIVASGQGSDCTMQGTFFGGDKYPAHCANGLFTAGVVFFFIGISPILCMCAMAAVHVRQQRH